MAAFEKVGVELVVEGLATFIGRFGKVASTIQSLIPTSKLLGNAFQWVGGIISGFVGGAARTLEYALGSLISAAIQKVIGFLKEMAAEIIVNTSELQKLEVRLNRLNYNDLSDDIKESGKAMEFATATTKEQLRWINKLAAATPFDAKNIAQTYTLARTYGFTADEAKKLTSQIADFASGMGLTGTHIERIVQNLGQMKAAGKITGTELRDLARGAFVPVNAVLEKAAENLGITTDQLSKLRQQGLTDAEVFFTAFGGLVEEDFKGATEDMNAVLAVAIENVKDMFGSMISLEVMGPIFKQLAGGARGLQQALFERWDVIEGLFAKIGEIFAEMLTDIMGLVPTADEMADKVVSALSGITGWLNSNKDGIVNWVKESAKWINETLIPAVKDLITWLFGVPAKKPVVLTMEQDYKNKGMQMPDGEDNPFAQKPIILFGSGEEGKAGAISKALEGISKFAKEASEWVGNVLVPFLRDDLQPVMITLQPLVDAVVLAFKAAFGGEVDQGLSDWIAETLIPFIEDLTEFINENRDTIALWLQLWLKGAITLAYISVAIGVLIGLVGEITAAIVGWLSEDNNLINVLYVVAIAAGLVALAVNALLLPIGAVILVIGAIVLQFMLFKVWLEIIQGAVQIFKDFIETKFREWKENVSRTFDEVMAAIKEKDWEGAGRAFVDGIMRGISNSWGQLLDLVGDLAQNAMDAFTGVFNIGGGGNNGASNNGNNGNNNNNGGVSSQATGSHGWRTVPPGFNNDNYSLNLMSGERYMVIPKGGQMSSAMAGSTVNSNRSVQNNYNLNIQSSAPTEPIVSDFAMLSSMQGA